MKTFRITLLMFALAVIFVQCGTDPKARIRKLEKKIGSRNFTFNEEGMKTANDLVAAYIAYADSLKDSQEAPDYLFNAAELSLNLNNPQQSVALYNRIIYQYPDYPKTPECLFFIAFIYENNFQNYGKAVELYEAFIAKYPNHDFTDDARISIENIGKSPEELIREFEAKNKGN